MKKIVFIFLVASIVGCSSRPVLYDNAKYKRTGEDRAQADVDNCMEKAERAGATNDKVGGSAKQAGKGAVVGAAGGAVGSAIYGGNVGRGVGAGAAAGATSTFLWGIFDSQPDPIYRNYVNTCLREKGYKVLGWK